MDETRRRQSAARRRLGALQPLHARCRRRARGGKRPSKRSSRRAPARRSPREGRRRGINATVIAAPADVLADPHLRARGFWRDRRQRGREPGRFVSVTASGVAAPAAAGRAQRRRVRCARAARRVSACSISPGRWSARSPPRRWAISAARSSRSSRATRPCLSRLDVQVSASRAGNFDDKPWFSHLNTSKLQPRARPEAAGEPRGAGPADRLGGRRRRELLARHASRS